MQCKFGWFANPVFGSGDYPQVMKDVLAKKCKAMGRESTLPEFTEEEKKNLKGINRFAARMSIWAGQQLFLLQARRTFLDLITILHE